MTTDSLPSYLAPLLSEEGRKATEASLAPSTFTEPTTTTKPDKWTSVMQRSWTAKGETSVWSYVTRNKALIDSVSVIPFWVDADGKLVTVIKEEDRVPFGRSVFGFAAGMEESVGLQGTAIQEAKEELGITATEDQILSHGGPAALIEPLSDIRDTLIPMYMGAERQMSEISEPNPEKTENLKPRYLRLDQVPSFMSTLKGCDGLANAQLAAFNEGYKMAKLEYALSERASKGEPVNDEVVHDIWRELEG